MPKSRDELARSFYKIIKNQKQNKDKMLTGDITEKDLMDRAYELADNRRAKTLERLEDFANRPPDTTDVRLFRAAQEKKYRDIYEWNGANDEATLNHILNVESDIYELRLLIDNRDINIADRRSLMDQHSKLADAHKTLLAAAGIDRVARDKKRDTNQPFEDWVAIKREAKAKMDTLAEELPTSLAKCDTDRDLLNTMKHHLGYPFSVLEPILATHRRILNKVVDD